MTVHDQANTQQPIQHRVLAPARNECGGCQWYETRGQKAFEGPVVGAMRFGRSRKVCWVIYSAFVNRYVRMRDVELGRKECTEILIEHSRPPGTYAVVDVEACLAVQLSVMISGTARSFWANIWHQPWMAANRAERPEADRKVLGKAERRRRDEDMVVVGQENDVYERPITCILLISRI